jgi:hypothetical protein
VFYASTATSLTGPTLDQAHIMPDFTDTTTQDNAYQAIHAATPIQPTTDDLTPLRP